MTLFERMNNIKADYTIHDDQKHVIDLLNEDDVVLSVVDLLVIQSLLVLLMLQHSLTYCLGVLLLSLMPFICTHLSW